MAETEEVETTETDQIEEVESEEQEQEQEEDPNAGLKKALAAERKAHKDAAKRLRELEQERELANKAPDEQALELARREAAAEATTKANDRIVRAEIRAAAANRVKNPALAVKLIDASAIEVDDDGEVDADALASAIDTLLTDYPELAATAPGFGSADQGAKGRAAAPKQLTDYDLEQMSPAEINKARREGRLDKLLGKS
jgi:hypothetical protein